MTITLPDGSGVTLPQEFIDAIGGAFSLHVQPLPNDAIRLTVTDSDDFEVVSGSGHDLRQAIAGLRNAIYRFSESITPDARRVEINSLCSELERARNRYDYAADTIQRLRDDLRDADAQIAHLESDNAKLRQELAVLRSFAVSRSDDAWKSAVQTVRLNNPYASAFAPMPDAVWHHLQALVQEAIKHGVDRYGAALMCASWDACASAIEEMAIEMEVQP